MAWGKANKVEGGSGGKRGHSNMSHWDETEYIKECSRRLRRIQTRYIKQLVKQVELEKV